MTFILGTTKDILKNCQWDPMMFWTSLTFIAWTKAVAPFKFQNNPTHNHFTTNTGAKLDTQLLNYLINLHGLI